MSVRKRTWTTGSGEKRTAWIADYVDARGVRRQKTFKLKKEADAFAADTAVKVRAGDYLHDKETITVLEAGELWLTACENAGLERSTLQQYRSHLNLHISPLIGHMLLTQVGVPAIRQFRDDLQKQGRSLVLRRKVMSSLRNLFDEAQERKLAVRNPVREITSRRKTAEDRYAARSGRVLEIGSDIPTPDEIRSLVATLTGKWRPIIITAIFSGLRASELRGLSWQDVDLENKSINVRQRADRFNQIGPPKSKMGRRSVPVPPIVVSTLREWRLACPRGPLNLVFPNGQGRVESLSNIVNRGLKPAMFEAGVTIDGQPKYKGFHALRHFYASWLINRAEDGGLGLPYKTVQARMGHASIGITLDTYSHIFPEADINDELAAAEARLLS